MTDRAAALVEAVIAAARAALDGAGFTGARLTATPREDEPVPFVLYAGDTATESPRASSMSGTAQDHTVTLTCWGATPTQARAMRSALVPALTAGDRAGATLTLASGRVVLSALDLAFSTTDPRPTGTVAGQVLRFRYTTDA